MRNEEAARMEADRYKFQAAIQRLKRAQGYALSEKRDELEREILILECRDASKKRDFEGSKKALERCKAWLEEHGEKKDPHIFIQSLNNRSCIWFKHQIHCIIIPDIFGVLYNIHSNIY